MTVLGIGVGAGITHIQPQPAFTLAGLSNKRLLLDARTIVGSHGDHLATLVDGSGLGNDFAQGVDGSRPTLNTSWQGSQGIATSGSQFATLGNGLLTGITSFSLAWVGQFSSVSGPRVAFCLGNNAADGFDFDANRASTGKFSLFMNAVSANDTTTTADTAAHIFIVTYDAAATPKWTIEMDGVALTLGFANVAPLNPTTRSVFGGVNAVGAFGMAGNTGLLFVCSGVWTGPTKAAIRADAKKNWTLP